MSTAKWHESSTDLVKCSVTQVEERCYVCIITSSQGRRPCLDHNSGSRVRSTALGCSHTSALASLKTISQLHMFRNSPANPTTCSNLTIYRLSILHLRLFEGWCDATRIFHTWPHLMGHRQNKAFQNLLNKIMFNWGIQNRNGFLGAIPRYFIMSMQIFQNPEKKIPNLKLLISSISDKGTLTCAV